jgi:hypothetical protein
LFNRHLPLAAIWLFLPNMESLSKLGYGFLVKSTMNFAIPMGIAK